MPHVVAHRQGKPPKMVHIEPETRLHLSHLPQGTEVVVKAILHDTAEKGDGTAAGYPCQNVLITITQDRIAFQFPEIGTEEPDEAGRPMFVQFEGGDPQVYIWDGEDGDAEGPSHVIPILSEARR